MRIIRFIQEVNIRLLATGECCVGAHQIVKAVADGNLIFPGFLLHSENGLPCPDAHAVVRHVTAGLNASNGYK